MTNQPTITYTYPVLCCWCDTPTCKPMDGGPACANHSLYYSALAAPKARYADIPAASPLLRSTTAQPW